MCCKIYHFTHSLIFAILLYHNRYIKNKPDFDQKLLSIDLFMLFLLFKPILLVNFVYYPPPDVYSFTFFLQKFSKKPPPFDDLSVERGWFIQSYFFTLCL